MCVSWNCFWWQYFSRLPPSHFHLHLTGQNCVMCLPKATKEAGCHQLCSSGSINRCWDSEEWERFNGEWHCERSRKPNGAGGASIHWCKPDSLCQPGESQGCPLGESCVGWKWLGLCITILLSYWLGAALRRAGSQLESWQELITGDSQLTTLFDMGSKSFPEARGFDRYIPTYATLENGGFQLDMLPS